VRKQKRTSPRSSPYSEELLSTGARCRSKRDAEKAPLNLASRLGLNQVELANLTGKSPSYWRRLAKLGLGPRAIRAGGRGLIFPVSAVREWLDRNAIDPADVAGR
jgi:predicted DNA-binding transcriptional regulator AlpA